MGENNKEKQNAANQERVYILGRSGLLILLALSSMVVTFRIGGFVAEMMFSDSMWFKFIVQNAFVLLGYVGIDLVLANALSSASNVNNKKTSHKKTAWNFAIAALLSTVFLSLASSLFLSQEIAGKSHLGEFNDQVKTAMSRDSALTMKALSALQDASKEEKERIKDAKLEAKQLLSKAIGSGSPSWQNDYQKHKDLPNAWFWTCKECPSGYKSYRQRIIEAKRKGEELSRIARNYSEIVRKTLSPTLEYKMSNDTSLAIVQSNVLAMEKERKSKQWLVNLFLLALIVSSGGLSLYITRVIKEHREEHGQYVIEDYAKPVIALMDMVTRLATATTDILYTLMSYPVNYLEKRGYITRFRVSTITVTDTGLHGSVITDKAKTFKAKKNNRYPEETPTDNRAKTTNTYPEENPTDKAKTIKAKTIKAKNKNGYPEETPTDNKAKTGLSKPERTCIQCKTDISHKRSDAKYCSDRCRMAHHDYKPRKKST